VGRLLAEAMGRDLGVNIVVENVGGGGGTIGVNRVAQARPDGQMLLLHNIGMATAPTLYRNLPYNPLTSFETIGLVTPTPMVWITRPDFPGEGFADMLRYIRERRDGVNLANAGLGSASQLCGTLLQASLGVGVTAVQFRGSGPRLPGADGRPHRHLLRPDHQRDPLHPVAPGEGDGGDHRAAAASRCRACRRRARPACRASRSRSGTGSTRPGARRGRWWTASTSRCGTR
jgi:hypothetical protein